MNDGINVELNRMLVETFNEINRVEERQLHAVGEGKLSITEFHLLSCVAHGERGRRTIGEIAESLMVTLPTVTVAVKRMEAKGYVQRNKNASDGRSSFISLTDEGKRMNLRHEQFHQQMVHAIRQEFSDEEIVFLHRFVKKLNEFFKENHS